MLETVSLKERPKESRLASVRRAADVLYKQYLTDMKDEKRLWAHALRMKLEEEPHRIDNVIDAMLDAAAEGDVQAFKEIRDTMDGKPLQQTEITGKDGADLFANMSTEEIKERLKTIIADPETQRILN